MSDIERAIERLEMLSRNAMRTTENGLAEELGMTQHFTETNEAIKTAITALREQAKYDVCPNPCELVKRFIDEQAERDSKHGKWIPVEYNSIGKKCSVCGEEGFVEDSYMVTGADNDWFVETNYCPNCGVKMDGEHDSCD